MIIIIDGLDSVEQRKVLKVLDTVHTLFSGTHHLQYSTLHTLFSGTHHLQYSTYPVLRYTVFTVQYSQVQYINFS